MKIQLKNFRCFEDNIFNIKDRGLILISGESGKGKSTLLNSILYTLYGCLTKVTTYGRKGCKTSLQIKINDKIYEIIRSKRKNVTLNIFIDSKKTSYIDEVAQSMINEEFGDVNKFKTCSYLIQKEQCKIFSSAKDRDDFFRNMVFTDKNKEIKQKIKIKIKTQEKDTDRLESKIEVYKSQMNNILDNFKKPVKPKELNSKTIKEYKKYVNKLNDKYHELNKELQIIHDKYNKYNKYLDLMDKSKEIIKNNRCVDDKIGELEKEIQNIKEKVGNTLLSNLEIQLYKNNKSKIKLEELLSQIPIFKRKIRQTLSRKIKHETKIEKIESEIKVIKENIENLTCQYENKEIIQQMIYDKERNLSLNEELSHLILKISNPNLTIKNFSDLSKKNLSYKNKLQNHKNNQQIIEKINNLKKLLKSQTNFEYKDQIIESKNQQNYLDKMMKCKGYIDTHLEILNILHENCPILYNVDKTLGKYLELVKELLSKDKKNKIDDINHMIECKKTWECPNCEVHLKIKDDKLVIYKSKKTVDTSKSIDD